MNLIEHLKIIQDSIRAGRFGNEDSVKQGIVLRILQVLKWPVFDPQIVYPEFPLENRKVDYALCPLLQTPKIIIEVKKIGNLEGGDRQLFEYAFHKGTPMCILTDGQEWHFYLPGEQGAYSERKVYQLDLLERDLEESDKRLNRYLSFQNVADGKAIENAREDYISVSRNRNIKKTLPEAWRKLIEEEDSLLVELLAEKVAEICGYTPDINTVVEFLRKQDTHVPGHEPLKPSISKLKILSQPQSPEGFVGFTYKGEHFQEKNAVRTMISIFNLLAKKDQQFLERFMSRKHGRTRRYVAHKKEELYPHQSLDFCVLHSVQLDSKLWIGTNYSKGSIEKIIEMACEVAELQFGSDLIVTLGN